MVRNLGLLGLLLVLFSFALNAQVSVPQPDFHYEGTTNNGNKWSLDIRNIRLIYKFPQTVTNRKDQSLMTGGFADDGSVNIDVKYDPVKFIVWNGQQIPLSDIKGAYYSKIKINNPRADIYSGNRFIRSVNLSTQGGMEGNIGGNDTQNANQPVSWKQWLGVSTMDEVNKIFDGGLKLKNAKFDIGFSSFTINSYVDKLAKEQQKVNEQQAETSSNAADQAKVSSPDSENSNTSSSSYSNSSPSPQNNTPITGSKPPTQRTMNQYDYQRQQEIEQWNRNYEREVREWNQAFERRQEQARIMRQQKDQMVNQAAENIANMIIKIAEQKEKERLRAKSAKIRRTLDEIVNTVERFGRYHEDKIQEITDITSRNRQNLSMTTLRRVDKEMKKAYDDKIKPVDEFMKEFQQDMKDMEYFGEFDDPDYFPIQNFENDLNRFLSANSRYYDYGIPNILNEARKDVEENPKAEPYYTSLSRIHIARLKRNCKFSNIETHVSTLMRINRNAGNAYSSDLERARTVRDGRNALGEENKRRQDLYNDFQNNYAKVKIDGSGGIFTYKLSNTVEPSFATPQDLNARIIKAQSTINQCRSANNMSSTTLKPKDFKNRYDGFKLVRPGDVPFTVTRRYHYTIDTVLMVEAPNSYTIKPRFWNHRKLPFLHQFTKIDYKSNPRKDYALQEITFLGFLGKKSRSYMEYSFNGQGHTLMVPLLHVSGFKPNNMRKSIPALYFGVGFDLFGGMSNTNITSSRSVVGNQSSSTESNWMRYGGSTRLNAGFLTYFTPRVALNLEANGFIHFNGLTYEEDIQYTFGSESASTLNKYSLMMVLIGVNPNVGLNFHLGKSVFFFKYGINIFAVNGFSENEIKGFDNSGPDIETERVINLFNNFPEDNLNALYTIGILF